jgi:hypothetical protein
MFLCQKFYLCKKLSMLFDSNGFKPYIYFVFLNLSMYHTHTHTHTHTHIFYWPYTKIRWVSSFRVGFEVSGTAEAVFTRHVWPLAQTYLVSWTCPAPVPDMYGYRVSQLYKGDLIPLWILASFSQPISSVCSGWAPPRWFGVSSTKTPRFLGDLTPLFLRIFQP